MNSTWVETHEGGRTSREAERPDDGEGYRLDLVRVLLAHPGGLRRWSVMRAIRNRREKLGQEVSFKLEEKVERIFRQSCVDDIQSDGRKSSDPRSAPLFYRPKDRAGEVWAIDGERARAWLDERGDGFPPDRNSANRMKAGG